ncbi:hypothetical protein [uncultured Fibrella sp.]|uniref:hypothetical protein n=1 Tax=uncultured Fibrella sp. TaxID=1284596 RepID=UPI0035CC3140
MAINLNEEATLTLKANTRDFANEIAVLDTKAKDLKQTLSDIEKTGAGKGSEEWKKYRTELTQVNAELAKTRKETDLTKLTYGQLGNLVKQLNADLKGLVPGTEAFVNATKRLDDAKARLSDVSKQVNSINTESTALGQQSRWQKVASGVSLMGKAFQAIMALQVIGYIIEIGKSIFDITGKFERYEKVLTNALGSEKLAKQSLAAISQMAKNTVFTVDELTEGYVKLVNRGMRPSQKEMIAMTDLAASQGKKFDELVEAALDAQTGEFERLKEFGIRATKSGDSVTMSFKGMNQTVKNTPEAIQGAITKFGEMNGVAGQNATMMSTLEGQTSNLSDSFDALKVEMGQKLRPVFVAIIQVINGAIPVVRLLANVLFTVISAMVTQYNTLTDFAAGAAGVLGNLALAAHEFLQGNFAAAAVAWDKTKAAGAKTIDGIKTNAKQGAAAIIGIWSDPAATTAADFAGKAQGKAHQDGLTDAQKKALKEREAEEKKAQKQAEADLKKYLEDVGKANQKAIEDLHKLEADAHIASIQDEQKRELTKILAKHDLAVEEIMRGIQDEKLKNQQIAFLDQQLQGEVTKLQADHAEKRRKKSEDEEKARLETQKNILEQERQAENALLDWKEINAKGNATKLAAIHLERVMVNYRATVEKLEAEEAAEKAKATREITDKDQLDRAITAIEARYHNEQLLASAKTAEEKAKIEEELKAKKKAIWGEVSSAFGALLKGDMSSFLDHADKLVQGEKSAMQKKLAANQETYAAIGSMASQAAQFLADLAKAKADRAIAEINRERDANVAALNDKVAKEQAAIDKIESDKQRIKSESDAKIEMLRTNSEQTISNLESQYRQLSSSEEKAKLTDQLQGYRDNADGKTEAAKQAAEDAIDAAKLEAKETIDAAQKTEAAAIKSAVNEKNEKIDAAEATRDAEIASINKRTDIDQATRKTLLAEAKDKFELEKKQATEEADHKIESAKAEAKTKVDLANSTQKTKIELANDQRDAELKAIEAIRNGDEKAAKEILARAKSDAKDKIALAKDEATKKIDEAEREKREKLKKVEAEKATRIANQKDLNRAIEQENARAKAKEAEEKRKAWQAQKKADTASALITGALSVIKALASGFWPVNLVFAAMAAVMTGIQVAKINSQPMPQFEGGGFIPQGGRHGSTYGTGGLAIVDRQSGREQGEMEGGEAIISREQTKANLPIIHRMFANARTPGRRNQPVTTDRDALGRPAGFRDGGLFDGFGGSMYVYGGVIPKSRKRYDEGGMVDGGSDGGGGESSGGESSGSDGLDSANSDYEESKKQFEKQVKALEDIRLAVVQASNDNRNALNSLYWGLGWQNSQLRDEVTSAIRAMSQNLQNTITTSNEGLRTSLALLVLRQQNDNKEVIKALQAGFGLMQQEERTTQRAVATNTAAVETSTRQNTMDLWRLELTMASNLSRLEQHLVNVLTDQTRTLDDRMLASTTSLVRSQDAATRSMGLSLANLALSMSSGMLRLSDSMTLGLTQLRQTTTQELRQSATRQEVAMSNLGSLLYWSMTDLASRTERSLAMVADVTKTGLRQSADRTAGATDAMANEVRGLRWSINSVEAAVWANRQATQGVEGAIWGSNQQGRLDALIATMSVFGKK